MPGTNTGYKGYAKLLKVTDDGTHRALDVNNELCSESGLPQDFKTNINTDPDYVAPVLDTTMCPIPVTGIAVPSQTGSSHCSTGVCLLNGSLASVTVYTISGILSPGQTVWADLGMTTLYLTSSYIKQVGHSELYTVNGSGILSSPQCSEGGSCGI